MLGLKCDTSKLWVGIAENNLQLLLTDHAFAEQKAAAAAMSLIIGYSEDADLVSKMQSIALEEIEHFGMVHKIIVARGLTLLQDQNSAYAKHLFSFFNKTKDRTQSLVNRLLISALIEARSCERFKMLSLYLKDTELAAFYKDLLASEAGHHTLFLGLANRYESKEIVTKKWDALTTYEAEYIKKQGKTALVHG
ncbi:MAG: tRNA 2-methylthio-N6-isopentenyl adenosine(37) hydroxylase MiaE [Flavobacteriaceae bacterium]|nr:tRNA 2-methylthio-N6-isopentenyl adenosine(37) hydroxylase MiaE [Flavobacteriaceae bacterium]